MADTPLVAVIRGDGIGGDVTEAALAVAAAALARCGNLPQQALELLLAPDHGL